MMGRLAVSVVSVVSVVAGIAAASLVPGLQQSLRSIAGLAAAPGNPAPRGTTAIAEPRGSQSGQGQADVKLTQDQITTAEIGLATVGQGMLARRIAVPGTIVPHADRIAHVSVKLSATVAELRKKIGDPVTKDEVLAVLESREVADAKSDYLAARLTNELQQDLFERDKTLWDKRVSNEQQFLRSRNAAAQSRMRLDIARQKLLALGLTEREIAAIPDEPETSLRRQEVRSPIAGRIVERKVELGMAVGRDNLETELFVIIDLGRVWVELPVSPADLPAIKEGQPVSVSARTIAEPVEGRIVFVSPLLDRETRSARVVVEIANDGGAWRPGSFVTASITIDQQAASLVIPLSAIQSIGREKVVFVRTPDGFAKRPIALGLSDNRFAEVSMGLRAGDIIATTNTFSLKAELMKASAED